ncbi:hypothetical protein FA95DRAFT_1563422 [Auriscalpium vulgare]|uniref:Uncharacterized protein n=1 Tax=Auriscalpium vulgare TaxID=40419 RepID=A0ACB8RGW6_9AGAM|nr:hypothetical protein FA95DRAFT_1563422 [Auriscalpium vulgare]
MSSLPDPRSERRMLQKPLTPAACAYIVFTLDPVATLEDLKDPIAVEQARAMGTSKYVGMVIEGVDLASPYRPYHTCTCSLLSQGLPTPSPSEGIDEAMCVPIAPATHPSGRMGINPSPPLPWDNLYHHSMLNLDLRIRTKAGDYYNCPLLSISDELRLFHCTNKDVVRRMALEKLYMADHPTPPASSCGPCSDTPLNRQSTAPCSLKDAKAASPLDTDSNRSSASVPRTDSVDELDATNSTLSSVTLETLAQSPGPDIIDRFVAAFEPTDDDVGFQLREEEPDETAVQDAANANASYEVRKVFGDVATKMAENFFGHDDPENRFTPVVDFSTDLSTVEEFCDARQFFDEMEVLDKIREESEKRRRDRAEYMKQRRSQDRLEYIEQMLAQATTAQPSADDWCCPAIAEHLCMSQRPSAVTSTIDATPCGLDSHRLSRQSLIEKADVSEFTTARPRIPTSTSMPALRSPQMALLSLGSTKDAPSQHAPMEAEEGQETRVKTSSEPTAPVRRRSLLSRLLSIVTLGCSSPKRAGHDSD